MLKMKPIKEDLLQQKHRATLRASVVDAALLQRFLNTFPRNERKNVDVSVDVRYDLNVYLYTQLKDVESFRTDTRLHRILDAFLGDDAWQASSTDYVFSGVPNRDFRFSRTTYVEIPPSPAFTWLTKHGYMNDEKLPCHITCTIAAYAKADSATCVIKKTATERTIVDTRTEIVCL